MEKIFKASLLSSVFPASVASLLFLMPLPTHALFGGGGGGTVYCTNCATSADIAGVVAAIGTSTASINKAIQGAATSQTAATNENARIVSEANLATEVAMQKARVAEVYTMPDPCTITAPGRGNVAGSERVRSYSSGRGASGGGATSAPTAGASTTMQRALSISSGATPAPAPEVVAAIAASGACGTFAKGAERDRMCRGAKFNPAASPDFPNADVRAETLFDGPQSAADIAKGVVRHLTIPSGNTKERTAVAAFIRNLETPLDLRALTAAELDSSQGRNYMSLRDSFEAVMSMATKPLRDQEALLVASRDTIGPLNQMLAGMDGPFVQSWLDSVYSNWRSEGISQAEMMNLEAVRRYKNEAWYVRMAAADARQLQLESLGMQALQIWQTNLMLERQQQANILAGSIVGALARQEKMPQLVAVHKSAQGR